MSDYFGIKSETGTTRAVGISQVEDGSSDLIIPAHLVGGFTLVQDDATVVLNEPTRVFRRLVDQR